MTDHQEQKKQNSGGNQRPIVEMDTVGKCYILQKQRPFLIHDAIRRLVRKYKSEEPFWALQGVSLRIQHGESLAIIGGNGAGKSTLLGLVAGTVAATRGQVRVHGRIGALLELGAGFHPDLTGRENIYLNASLLGLQRAETEAQYDKIVAFSELQDFIDVPLRTYSSGMQVRLGFSVAVHIYPEILIMDEVLAVGDQHFQQKCIQRILQFRDEGKTLLFVSHSPDAVKTLCQRVVWLEHGRLRIDGPVKDVLAAYQAASQ